jgi:hypothetical protein
MKDLLKEAIADAKAVRQTALANAKLALEEAFTPRLQSMLSAKLAEEMSDEDEEVSEGEEEYADNMPTFEEGEDSEGEETMDSEEAMDTDSGEGEEMPEDDYSEESDDDLDLDEIIKELEMEGGDSETSEYEDEPMGEGEDMEDDLYEEGEDMADDEEVDIQEIVRSLREEDEEEAPAEEEESSSEDLAEAYNVIKFLKGKINEVNLLNAKLLYSNKLFRNFTLNENQKMKVIENFDRAHSLREVKLVYSTLAEGFKMPSTKKIVKESFASKPSASTKPARKQVISEGAELAARFKKLAGLK